MDAARGRPCVEAVTEACCRGEGGIGVGAKLDFLESLPEAKSGLPEERSSLPEALPLPLPMTWSTSCASGRDECPK
jgi:hypothetical protein